MSGSQVCWIRRCLTKMFFYTMLMQVTWSIARQQKPIELGEHGILDLQKIGWALRLWWWWLLGTSPSWLWQEFRLPCTNTVHAMFQGSTYVIVGNGRNTRFWTDCRMDDRSPADVVPTVLNIQDHLGVDQWDIICIQVCTLAFRPSLVRRWWSAQGQRRSA